MTLLSRQTFKAAMLAGMLLLSSCTAFRAQNPGAGYAPVNATQVNSEERVMLKGFDVVTWNGAFAPAGTPPEVIDTLNKEFRAVLADPELVRRYTELGLEPLPTTPDELSGRQLRGDPHLKRAGVEQFQAACRVAVVNGGNRLAVARRRGVHAA